MSSAGPLRHLRCGAAHPGGAGVAEPYRGAVGAMVVAPYLMATSEMHAQLEMLDVSSERRSEVDEDLVLTLLRNAFFAGKERSDAALRRHNASLPGVCDGMTCWWQEVMMYISSLSWEKPYLHACLRVVAAREDADGQRLTLALMVRAARECAARQRAAFSDILARATYFSGSQLRPVLSDAVRSDARLARACERVFRACAAVIADTKERAFRLTFLEPTALYAEAVHDDSVSVDVDVHGAPVHLCLLEACVGVRVGRLGEMTNEAKGIADFMAAAGMEKVLAVLWKHENLHRGRAAVRFPVSLRSVASNQFIWSNDKDDGSWGLVSVKEFVRRAATSKDVAKRKRYAAYVAQFCSYFWSAALLPRLISVLLSGGTVAGGSAAEDDVTADLQCVFDYLRAQDMVQPAAAIVQARVPADCTDVRHYVWDIEAIPPVFHAEAAQRLLAVAGVTKPLDWRMDAEASSSAAATAEAPAGGAPLLGPRIPAKCIHLTAAGDICGGGTGREFVSNLSLSETEGWCKWLHPGYVTSSWVLAEFVDAAAATAKPSVAGWFGRGRFLRGSAQQPAATPVPYRISGYALCSANDCPHRDPVAWRLEGRSTDGSWITMHEQDASDPGFEDRWHWLQFAITDDTPVTAVRLQILRVRMPGDCLQLGHFHIFQRAPSASTLPIAAASASHAHPSSPALHLK